MSDDPYQVLNVPRDATPSQIKSAYRKLALKYHPDKQSASKSDQEKKECSEKFTKIGNAYEILGDQDRRAQYDQYGIMDGSGGGGGGVPQQHSHNPNPFGGGFGFGGAPFDHPFFGGGFGSRQSRTANGSGFMDPFEIFRQSFGDDFHDFHSQGHGGGGSQRRRNTNRNGNIHESFGGDPFMNGFGFSGHTNMMNSMNSMFNNMQQQTGHGGNTQSYSTSYSSSSYGANNGGRRESVSTKTRIINGKRQTVTEKTIVHPDGRVETTTESTGDNDFPSSLEYGGQQDSVLLQDDAGHDVKRRKSRSSRY